MANNLRIGFIGAGRLAHEVHVPVLSGIPQVEPLVLCDIREAAMADALRRFGVRETTTRYQDVLKMQEVDAVVIAVPNYLHARIAEEALRAGKHVLCEKPSGITVREAQAVEAAARASGLVYMMALPHRFDSETRMLKRWVEAGHLGHIYSIRAGLVKREGCPGGWFTDRERSGGGALVQFGSHLLDLALWFLDFADVRRVSATSWQRPSTSPGRSVHDVEDSATVLLRVDGRRSVVLETAWSMHCETDREYLELYGEKAGASLWPLRMHQEMEGVAVDVVPRHIESRSHQELAQHFVECVLASERGIAIQPMGNARDGVRLAHLTQFIYESAETDREIEVAAAMTTSP